MWSKNKEQKNSAKNPELLRLRTFSHSHIDCLPCVGSIKPKREPRIPRPLDSHHSGDHDLFLSCFDSALHDDHASSIR